MIGACAVCLWAAPSCTRYAVPSTGITTGCDGFEPWEDCTLTAKAESKQAEGAADGLLVAYQSAMRRPQVPAEGCIFYPSCSNYSRQAFARYGEIGGAVFTLDRLMVREHSAAFNYYPAVQVDGSVRLYDPVP
jgi:putative component of membrane protein insertase Oxa1/YidC/SpoIIIJ protein YidD